MDRLFQNTISTKLNEFKLLGECVIITKRKLWHVISAPLCTRYFR